MTRIFQPIELVEDARINLDDRAVHYLLSVLRAKAGDALVLFNGQGGEYAATIEMISKKNIVVFIEKYLAIEVESPLDLCLAQGIARGEKMDFIVQKAVELGVKRIIPLLTERCNVRLSAEREAKRMAHWQGIIISACEQCGRNCLPEIATPQTFTNWITSVQSTHRFILSPREKVAGACTVSANDSVTLLIGSEGGLTDKEAELAKFQNFIPFHLGPRILRTETATIAALAIAQSKWGDG